jgi:hypothetical protein
MQRESSGEMPTGQMLNECLYSYALLRCSILLHLDVVFVCFAEEPVVSNAETVCGLFCKRNLILVLSS